VFGRRLLRYFPYPSLSCSKLVLYTAIKMSTKEILTMLLLLCLNSFDKINIDIMQLIHFSTEERHEFADLKIATLTHRYTLKHFPAGILTSILPSPCPVKQLHTTITTFYL
jgi:hypothetical protein